MRYSEMPLTQSATREPTEDQAAGALTGMLGSLVYLY